MFTYSINIARAHDTAKQFDTGKPIYLHFCRVAIPDHSTDAYALEVFAHMERGFPMPKFKVTLSKWTRPSGQVVAESL